MTTPQMTKTISSIIALSIFVIALVSGLAVENSGVTVLTRALVALVIGQAIGLAVATAARFALAEYFRQYRDAHPIDDSEMRAMEVRLGASA